MPRKSTTPIIPLTLAGFLLASAGCGQRMGGLRARIEANKLARSVPVQGSPVTIGQITAIDIENPWGDVVIDARPRNEESFIAFKVRKERHLRWRGAWQGFEFDPTGEYFTAVHETNGEVGTVVIRPTDLTVEGFRPPIDVIVYVPRADGVRVRNAGGDVKVIGAVGEIDVRSGTDDMAGGDIEIRTDGRLVDPIIATSNGGDVKIVASKDSAGTIELEAPRGRVTFDGRYGVTQHSRPEKGRWTGVWNDGLNQISLRSETGDAVMVVVDHPTMYTLKGW
ncbi:MAG: hypothetical protein D6692_03080 [Planctomycetota bacterium]|nr:MAG: hypothetical protein D6692_03080 [Planctomycetota bacterium]